MLTKRGVTAAAAAILIVLCATAIGQVDIDSADVLNWCGGTYVYVVLPDSHGHSIRFGANQVWELDIEPNLKANRQGRRKPSVEESNWYPSANVMVTTTEETTGDTSTQGQALVVTRDSITHLGWIYDLSAQPIQAADVYRCAFLAAPLPLSFGTKISHNSYAIGPDMVDSAVWHCSSHGTLRLSTGVELTDVLGLAHYYTWDGVTWCEHRWFSKVYGPVAVLTFHLQEPVASLMEPGTQLIVTEEMSPIFVALDLSQSHSVRDRANRLGPDLGQANERPVGTYSLNGRIASDGLQMGFGSRPAIVGGDRRSSNQLSFERLSTR